MRGGVDASSPVPGEEVAGVGTGPTEAGEASTSEPTSASIEERVSELEKIVTAMKDDKLGTTSAKTDDVMGGGGKKSKKNRSNKIKDKKGKSFRKKCGW